MSKVHIPNVVKDRIDAALTSNDGERAAFEALMKCEFGWSFDLTKKPDGSYHFYPAISGWAAWKAARSQAQPPAKVKDKAQPPADEPVRCPGCGHPVWEKPAARPPKPEKSHG